MAWMAPLAPPSPPLNIKALITRYSGVNEGNISPSNEGNISADGAFGAANNSINSFNGVNNINKYD